MAYKAPTRTEVEAFLKYDKKAGTLSWLPGTHGFKVAQRKHKHIAIAGTKDSYGHLVITVKFTGQPKRTYKSHRLAWLIFYGVWPKMIDHKNRIPHDNRIENLRETTFSKNNANSESRPGSSSKYKGVRWHPTGKRWCAAITVNKKTTHLGSFKNEIDAARTYDDAAWAAFGEAAFLNLPRRSARR